MKAAFFAITAGFGLFTLAVAQEMPQCATDCLAKHLADSACDPTDFGCICADTTLMNEVGVCSMGSCTVLEGLAARNGTATLCNEPVRDRSMVAPIATAVSGGFAIVFILLRLLENGTQKEFSWADLCAYSAWGSSVPMNVFEFFMMRWGMGRDIWTLTEEQITNVVKYTWVTQVSYVPAINLTKMSILFFYLKVFPVESFQWVCWATMIHCVLFMVATFVAAVLACVPVEHAWVAWKGEGGGVCFNNNAFWWAVSAINIITDLWILALPIRRVLRLELSSRKKVYLILMFGVGILITVVSIIRFEGLLTYSTSTNPTFNNVMVATYSVVECNVSVICCCMPNALLLLRRSLPHVFGTIRQESGPVGDSDRGGPDRSKQSSNSSGISKRMTYRISSVQRDNASDNVELMDFDENTRSTWPPHEGYYHAKAASEWSAADGGK